MVGGNGAGKSTLLRAEAGLVPVTAGRIDGAGQDITALRPDERAAVGVAFVSGARPVFPSTASVDATSSERPVVRLRAVTVRLRGVTALDHVDLDVHAGEPASTSTPSPRTSLPTRLSSTQRGRNGLGAACP